MGLFDGIFFPDNEQRSNRAIQLYNDCLALTTTLSQQKTAIETAVAAVKAALRDAAAGDGVGDRVEYHISGDWSLDMPALVKPLVSMCLPELDGAGAAASALVSAVPGVALINLFGLPAGFPKEMKAGPIDWKDLFGPAPAAIDGAVKRSQLRSLIGQFVAARVRMKRASMTNERLIVALESMAGNVASMTTVIAQTLPDAEQRKRALDAFVNSHIERHRNAIAAVDDAEARGVLDGLDRARGAWCEEDGYT